MGSLMGSLMAGILLCAPAQAQEGPLDTDAANKLFTEFLGLALAVDRHGCEPEIRRVSRNSWAAIGLDVDGSLFHRGMTNRVPTPGYMRKFGSHDGGRRGGGSSKDPGANGPRLRDLIDRLGKAGASGLRSSAYPKATFSFVKYPATFNLPTYRGLNEPVLLMGDRVSGHICLVTLNSDREGAWGKAKENARVRLRVDRAIWKPGEIPVLWVDLQNLGPTRLEYKAWGEEFTPEINGKMYRLRPIGEDWGPKARERSKKLLAPKGIAVDMPIALDEHWKAVDDGSPLSLEPGKYSVKVPRPVFSDGIWNGDGTQWSNQLVFEIAKSSETNKSNNAQK